jgi:excinuclease UvrABC nuclease subunit
MGKFSRVRNTPGVYVLFDLDERPLYVGKSGKLRGRLEQHFIRQDSSATADGLLDIYDVLRVAVWYAEGDLDAYEAAA